MSVFVMREQRYCTRAGVADGPLVPLCRLFLCELLETDLSILIFNQQTLNS